jgi:integrase
VLDYAEAEGLRAGQNPAAWEERLKHYLAAPSKARTTAVEHHAAMPWQELPAFMAQLAAVESIGARALQLIILTACRAGDLLGQKERAEAKLPARWTDIDFGAAVWSIPQPKVAEADRRPWPVPLSDAAMAILTGLRRARPDTALVAESEAIAGRPVNIKRLREALRAIAPNVDIHGFRASFRTWAGAQGHDRELAEACLNHRLLGDRAELAYKRDQLCERRRVLLEAWAAHCLPAPAALAA